MITRPVAYVTAKDRKFTLDYLTRREESIRGEIQAATDYISEFLQVTAQNSEPVLYGKLRLDCVDMIRENYSRMFNDKTQDSY